MSGQNFKEVRETKVMYSPKEGIHWFSDAEGYVYEVLQRSQGAKRSIGPNITLPFFPHI